MTDAAAHDGARLREGERLSELSTWRSRSATWTRRWGPGAQIFAFELRRRSEDAAFIDMGDQFIALMRTDAPHRDAHRHFRLVVDDRSRVRALARAAGAEMIDGGFLDFLDPWGSFIQVVEYRDLPFSETDAVPRGMGLDALDKTDQARKELAMQGML